MISIRTRSKMSEVLYVVAQHQMSYLTTPQWRAAWSTITLSHNTPAYDDLPIELQISDSITFNRGMQLSEDEIINLLEVYEVVDYAIEHRLNFVSEAGLLYMDYEGDLRFFLTRGFVSSMYNLRVDLGDKPMSAYIEFIRIDADKLHRATSAIRSIIRHRQYERDLRNVWGE